MEGRLSDILDALLDALIPADEDPGATQVGLGDFVRALLAGDAKSLAAQAEAGLEGLEAESQARHGRAFCALDPAARETLLEAVERGDVKAPWPTPPAAFFSLMLRLAAQGYYGALGAKGGWKLAGFDPRLGGGA